MKRILIILFILLCVSCSNNTVNKSAEMKVEEAADYNFATNLEVSNSESMPIQKFNNYLDLLKLKEKHPEFKKDILLQLKSFSKDSIILLNYGKDVSIEDIKQVGETKKVSDSIKKVKLVYQIVSGSTTKKDSVFAHIISKTIMLDGEEITSNKVKFSRE